MTGQRDGSSWRARVPRTAAVAAGGIIALVLLLAYLQGRFSGGKVAPGAVPLPTVGLGALQQVRVEERALDDVVEWPATVTARLEANLAPKVMARILDVRVGVGAQVEAGAVLVMLDDRDIRTKVQQAEAAVRASEARAVQADADLRRARTLFQKQAATQQDLDAAEMRAQSGRAETAQAQDALAEAQVMLSETAMRAPFTGVVAARLADPGDMAVPGKPVVIMHDPTALRLTASVAERCARTLRVGAEVAARVGTGPEVRTVPVEEIAPAADPQSRTVLVKTGLISGPDVRPGVFATLRLPCGTHTAVVIPSQAVQRTGQLETVRVLIDGEARLRSVRTGTAHGDDVEVLSGLAPGDTVLVGP